MHACIQAILFDAGDTLFRVRGSVGTVYAETAARHGVTVSAHEVDTQFRSAFRAMPPLAFPGVAPDALADHEYEWWKRLVRDVFHGVTFTDFDRFYDDLFQRFGRAEVWELFDDVRPTLAGLQAGGFRLAIVSNFDSRLRNICDGLGITPAFEAIVTSGGAGAAKPDPAIFLGAVAVLKLEPDQVLHVGDSLREDVAGARAAGLHAVHLLRGGREPSANPTIATLAELLGVLKPA